MQAHCYTTALYPAIADDLHTLSTPANCTATVLLQEVRYTADFQLVQMERKVARAAGHRSRDETEALSGRIRELEAALAAAAAEQGMLGEEVKRAEEDYGGWSDKGWVGGVALVWLLGYWCLLGASEPRVSAHHSALPSPCLPAAARAQRHSQAAQRERETIVADMARLSVEAGAVARAAKAAGKEREGRLVEVDVWKLEVRRLRTLLSRWMSRIGSKWGRGRGREGCMRTAALQVLPTPDAPTTGIR